MSITVSLGGPDVRHKRKECLCLSLASLTSGQQLVFVCAGVAVRAAPGVQRQQKLKVADAIWVKSGSSLKAHVSHLSSVFGFPGTRVCCVGSMVFPFTYASWVRFQALAVPVPGPLLKRLRAQCCLSILSFTGMRLHLLVPSLQSTRGSANGLSSPQCCSICFHVLCDTAESEQLWMKESGLVVSCLLLQYGFSIYCLSYTLTWRKYELGRKCGENFVTLALWNHQLMMCHHLQSS